MPRLSIPDAHIAQPLGTLESDDDYTAGKSGDLHAAIRVAERFITSEVVNRFKAIDSPVVLGVVSIEATGHNAIPQAAAGVLAQKLDDAALGVSIVQSTTPHRTALGGLDRVFNRPEFDGPVLPGRNYIIIDDTITQGGTFAALTEHIESNGAKVAGVLALSGKQYSRIMTLSDTTLDLLRQRLGDSENDFETATGRRFDALTESEARFIAKHKNPLAVASRIAEAAVEAARPGAAGAAWPQASDLTALKQTAGLEAWSRLSQRILGTPVATPNKTPRPGL